MLQAAAKGKPFGDFHVSEDAKSAFLRFTVPDEYRLDGVVDSKICEYRALAKEMSIRLAAYDEDGALIPGNLEHLRLLVCQRLI